MTLRQVSGVGSHARASFFSGVASNSIDTTTGLDSDVLDLDGWTKVWLEVRTAGFAAGTNLVGSLEFLHGVNGKDLSDLKLMPLTAAEFSGDFTTGVSLDEPNKQIDFAATLEANEVVALLCLKDIPPRLAARLRRGSGGDGTGLLSVNAYLFR
jgi:hypothetical protein